MTVVALFLGAVFGLAGLLARDYRRHRAGLPTVSNRAIGYGVLAVVGALVLALAVAWVLVGHFPLWPDADYRD